MSRGDLARTLEIAGTTIHPEISIAAHTDPAVPIDQDDALMLARARSVADTLVRAGTSHSVIEIADFGPAMPLAVRTGTPPRNARIEVTIR